MKSINLKTTPKSEIISQAVKVLQAGGLVIYPTETVYGLGADATNQEAVNKLLKFKGQRGLKPILIAVSDQNMAQKFVYVNDVAKNLYQKFLPGPVAVISRLKRSDLGRSQGRTLRSFATGISSPDGTVGIRIPAYPLILNIIRAFGKPITSTSANISGARHPWSLQDILDTTPKEKLDLIDLIIDAGQLPRRPPSTVIDTSREKTDIVREGEVRFKKILNTEYRILNKKYLSQSEKNTQQIAKIITRQLLSHSVFSIHNSVLVIALHGPLGAGKTVFTKGVAHGLGITEPIRSPSYTLVKEYLVPSSFVSSSLRLSESNDLCPSSFLYHVDAWRLSDPQEFADLGLEKMLRPGNIIVIEWIDRLAPILKDLRKQAKIILVEINVINNHQRNIRITS